jgi:hypothetical protein
MMRKLNQYFHFLCLIFLALPLSAKRSTLRPYDGSPTITTKWVGKELTHVLEDSHLEKFPLFDTFDKDYFYSHMLPTTPITLRYFPNQTIDPAVLTHAIEKFFYEVRCEEKQFSDFTVLKREAFNIRKQAGLLIVRGKTFPLNQFVVKLFMETPRSFIRAYNKGFIAVCHFIVGHGTTRYMLGFTRLKNLEMVKAMIRDNPTWKNKVDLPRKWFWIPEKYPWIELKGYNISNEKEVSLDFPGAYAIVADAINFEREFLATNKEDCKDGIDLFNDLDCLIDPHLNNFVREENTGKIVIIDTEHLPTMVALKEPVKMKSYKAWYSYLVQKGVHEYFGRTAGERKAVRSDAIPPYQGPEKYLKELEKEAAKVEKEFEKKLKNEATSDISHKERKKLKNEKKGKKVKESRHLS